MSEWTVVAERELAQVGPLQRGGRGQDVRRLQEWLALHGHGVAVDGHFGPATTRALAAFQSGNGLELWERGQVGPHTWEALTRPMRRAVAEALPSPIGTLRGAVEFFARRHEAQHPREVGTNAGPWPRLYCGGTEGLPWCAGFVSFILAQACAATGFPLPFPYTLSCDALAAYAKRTQCFLPWASSTSRDADADAEHPRAYVQAGDVFLVYRADADWTHTGIVVGVSDVVTTIEGNTNAAGGREGHEACIRTRGFDRLDFVLLH